MKSSRVIIVVCSLFIIFLFVFEAGSHGAQVGVNSL